MNIGAITSIISVCVFSISLLIWIYPVLHRMLFKMWMWFYRKLFRNNSLITQRQQHDYILQGVFDLRTGLSMTLAEHEKDQVIAKQAARIAEMESKARGEQEQPAPKIRNIEI